MRRYKIFHKEYIKKNKSDRKKRRDNYRHYMPFVDDQLVLSGGDSFELFQYRNKCPQNDHYQDRFYGKGHKIFGYSDSVYYVVRRRLGISEHYIHPLHKNRCKEYIAKQIDGKFRTKHPADTYFSSPQEQCKYYRAGYFNKNKWEEIRPAREQHATYSIAYRSYKKCNYRAVYYRSKRIHIAVKGHLKPCGKRYLEHFDYNANGNDKRRKDKSSRILKFPLRFSPIFKREYRADYLVFRCLMHFDTQNKKPPFKQYLILLHKKEALCPNICHSGMRNIHRKAKTPSSVRQLPVPAALHAHISTLFIQLYDLSTFYHKSDNIAIGVKNFLDILFFQKMISYVNNMVFLF